MTVGAPATKGNSGDSGKAEDGQPYFKSRGRGEDLLVGVPLYTRLSTEPDPERHADFQRGINLSALLSTMICGLRLRRAVSH